MIRYIVDNEQLLGFCPGRLLPFVDTWVDSTHVLPIDDTFLDPLDPRKLAYAS